MMKLIKLNAFNFNMKNNLAKEPETNSKIVFIVTSIAAAIVLSHEIMKNLFSNERYIKT